MTHFERFIQTLAVAGLLGACASPQPAAPTTGPTTPVATSSGGATTPAPTETAPGPAAPAEALRTMTVAELSALLEQHATVAIFDNNARERYERGHVPGARWAAYDGITADMLPGDRNTRLVFYCANEH